MSEKNWTDPSVETMEVTQKLKNGEIRTITKRILKTIDGLDLVQRVLVCEKVQDAVDATGLPADAIVDRIENYGRKMRGDGYEFDARDIFPFFAEYKAAVSTGQRGGARKLDTAAMAQLLNLKKATPVEA